jgi:hypothetical protein
VANSVSVEPDWIGHVAALESLDFFEASDFEALAQALAPVKSALSEARASIPHDLEHATRPAPAS